MSRCQGVMVCAIKQLKRKIEAMCLVCGGASVFVHPHGRVHACVRMKCGSTPSKSRATHGRTKHDAVAGVRALCRMQASRVLACIRMYVAPWLIHPHMHKLTLAFMMIHIRTNIRVRIYRHIDSAHSRINTYTHTDPHSHSHINTHTSDLHTHIHSHTHTHI